ncbi:hypothetical protein DYB32_004663 [Aphanomyces invadans]|uniref:Uncharacterized protein n=1 Tax=Aphanomyces invadans TaxID=157072 RepID=A0A418AWW4_9STRA|nr:hypothetical protein DYB32_004663 [Aphanomyces invadans]
MEATLAVSKAEQKERERIEAMTVVDEERWQEEELLALMKIRATLDEKRRKRQEAEAERDEKMLKAVMQVSMMEYNARAEIEKRAVEEELWLQFEADKALRDIERQKALAKAEKFKKLQTVLDMKKRAHIARESARKAVEELQAQERQRHEKMWQMQEENVMREQIVQLEAVRRRQEEAIAKRVEAERRADEALSRAQELRQKALAAAKLVRQTSHQAMEGVLQDEDVVRLDDHRRQLEVLDIGIESASRICEEKEMLAKEKHEHALALRDKALDAGQSVSKSIAIA